MTGPLCRYLEWDSEFFGRRIASAGPLRASAAAFGEILAWCGRERIDCLYFLADAADQNAVRLAEEHRFGLVDVRVTLDQPLASLPGGPAGVRPAAPEDLAELQRIARSSHQDSRFFQDAHFPREQCARLYETWIEKSCNGWAQAVLVEGAAGRPAGYITCHLADSRGRIGLLGVAEESRGRGVAQRLVAASLAWFAAQGAVEAAVVTQGRNVRAQRLYQGCGFRTRELQFWYHRWFFPE